MEPIRVKVYGLFALTRRRYLTQAVAGLVGVVLVFVGWCLGWPPLRERLTRPDLAPSAYRDWIVAVLNYVPWILAAAVVFKGIEVLFVLRIFARKETQVKKLGERPA